MINGLQFKNYKALHDVEIPLGRLNVFVGPNGSGKTSILQGIDAVVRAANRADSEAALTGSGEIDQVCSWGVERSVEVTIGFDAGEKRQLFSVTASKKRDDDASETRGKETDGWLFKCGSDAMGWKRSDVPPEMRDDLSPVNAFLEQHAKHIGTFLLLRLSADKLAAPSYFEGPLPCMETDGTGLASVLVQFKLTRPELWERYLSALREVIPSVRDIRFKKGTVRRTKTELYPAGEKPTPVEVTRTYWGDALVFDTTSGEGIEAGLMSEGTLIAAGILAAVIDPESPNLILLDDLDHALHPKAQRDLIHVFQRLLKEQPELQILATSHSPYLLDELTFDEVLLTTLDENGGAVVKRLDAYPDFERWKDIMTPGELWSAVGEAWIASKEPEATK